MIGLLTRFSTRKPLVTIGAWALLVLVSLGLIDRLLDSALTTDFRLSGRYESEQASALLEDRLRGPKQLTEVVVVQSPSLTVDDPAFRTKVESIHHEIMALGSETVGSGLHYWLFGNGWGVGDLSGGVGIHQK